MNLVLHGLLLQVIVSIVQFQYGFRLCSAGEPGYLDFDNLPETNFSCQGKVIGGYYADVEAGCQMFHVCTIGQKDEIMDIKFLCLNGTVFDQETRVCERVDEVDCSKSERFYNLNLELYGNNAVTLSLHDSGTEDENDSSELVEDHESHRTTSSRPSTTSSTTTTTPRPSISSTTSSSGSYQHSNGYPQHYQPQPRFPSVQTSQSKSLYDDKNGGYHHQYIYHTGDHRNNNVDINNDGNNNNNNQNDNNNNNNQATSYQLFNNQGVSSTTGAPQIRYSSTPSTQIQIHNDHQPTISPIFHATSSTIQTLLNSNANSPALINPIFHNHGIASTTEQFMVHNNNPRETAEYRDEVEGDERAEEDRRPLEAIQPTTQGKVSKLTISPPQEEIDRSGQQGKGSQLSSQQQQQQRATTNFLPTPASESGQAVRSFYPTPRTSTKSSSSHITHIHLPPPPTIPQLKPHQVTINLSPPDIQRIVQNPSPLLPSQSRVIVTAKASVSDESGRPLNSTQLVTLPIPTIPASYDDYKEGDESFDPFYRDVPKVRTNRRTGGHIRWSGAESRQKRSQRVRRDVDDVKIDEEKAAESSDDAGEEPKQKAAEVEASEKGEDDAESQNLKTESETGDTRNHTKTVPEDKVNEKIVIDTKESDEPEYVNSDDAVSKTAVHGGDTDDQELTDAKDDAFDSKIFDEPESQTSKEVDVRAIAQSDAKYAKDRSHRLDKEDKNSKSDNSNSLGTSKRHHEEKSSRFSLALPEVVDSESSAKHSTKKAQLEAEISEKDEETLEEEMGEEISEENLPEDDYYYDEEMDDASLKSNEGDSVEHSKEAPSKVDPSPKSNSARHSKSSKTDDATEEYYDVANDSTTQSNEQAGSDDLSDEYVDSQADASPDDSREVQDDEGESPVTEAAATQEPIDDVTSTTEQQIELSESTTMKQDKHSQNHEKHLSEGVLKFTDEIPKQEKTDEPAVTEKPEFVEETPQDYIDDNYEPQSYKEQKVSSSTVETITTEKIVEDATVQAADYDKDANESSTTVKSALDAVDDKEDKQNDQAPPESKVVETPLEKSIEKSLESEKEASTTISTTASTSTTTTPTAAVSTTTPATATTVTATAPPTEMTTTAPTTIPTTTTRSTTARPTPPKLFKPFTMRKSYVYVPPTTTPIPVIIKPRLPLLNPKPAKPPKSYNDLAPKPIIRKSPLYARKAYSTTRTTTPRELKAPEDSTEVPAETTENPTVEKITPSPSSTTTEASTTRITETSSPAATNSPSTKTDEISKITDNHVPISISQSFEASSTTESQTFTPYPMLRITEATTALEEDIGEASKPLHVDRSTTYRSYVESNDVPSATGSGTSSKIPEIITIVTPVPYSSSTPLSSSTQEPWHSELPLIEPTSDSSMLQNNVATNKPEFDIAHSTSVGPPSSDDTITTNEAINVAPTLASVKAVNRRPVAVKRTAFFNCLEKEMYRFYADGRDCRLFHYCSPGFTSRQVLDFRFVCEEGTAFDEETQSCIHDVKSPKCRKRVW